MDTLAVRRLYAPLQLPLVRFSRRLLSPSISIYQLWSRLGGRVKWQALWGAGTWQL